MFADDTNITISAETAEDLEEKLNNELNNVHNWLLANKLTVNVDKSEYMLIGPVAAEISGYRLRTNN